MLPNSITIRTLVIDSISKLFNVEIANEAERLGDKDAFGASKKPAVSYMRRLTSWLQRIDMNVIMVAHEKSEWGLINGQRSEVAALPSMRGTGWRMNSTLILNIIKTGPARLAKVGKSRLLGFPEGTTFPWSYLDFAERYDRDIIEKGKPTDQSCLCRSRSPKSNGCLMPSKCQRGTIEKWMAAAEGASSWGRV